MHRQSSNVLPGFLMFLCLLATAPGGPWTATAATNTTREAKTMTHTNNIAGTNRPAASKDPLAYRILQLPGGSIAQFDNWKYGPLSSGDNIVWCDGWPEGRQQEFVLRTGVATPSAQDLANLFTLGPRLTEQALLQVFGPIFQRTGEQKKCTCGGDEAMIENYTGELNGAKLLCRVLYVKRKDIAIAVLGVGKETAFKEFGRSIEIVAQSVTVKDSAVDASLVGTWVKENYVSTGSHTSADPTFNVSQSRSITIFPNGGFTDTATTGFTGDNVSADMNNLAQGAHRGTVVKRGNVLSFRYDNGQTWSPVYEAYSNGLKLSGDIYVKQ